MASTRTLPAVPLWLAAGLADVDYWRVPLSSALRPPKKPHFAYSGIATRRTEEGLMTKEDVQRIRRENEGFVDRLPAKARPKDDGERGHSFRKKKQPGATATYSTFMVGLRPTPLQRKALDLLVLTARHAYNWCLWLFRRHMCVKWRTRGGTRYPVPDQLLLQKVVACQNVDSIPDDHRPSRVSRQLWGAVGDTHDVFLEDDD